MEGGGIQQDKQVRKIFIGGLNYNTTEDGLKDYFGQFGNLVDIVVMKFPDTKRSRGFGFVTYSDQSEVDACQAARPHTLDGKTVETKRATPREQFGKPEAGQTIKRIFVGGLKEEISDEELKTYFTKFGNVVKVDQMTEKETGKKRGFGFVEFDDYDPVDKIVLQNRHEFNGHKIDIKKAISKQEMNNMSRGGGGRHGGFGGRGGGGGRMGGPHNGGRMGGGPPGGRMGGGGGYGGRGGMRGNNGWGNDDGNDGWGNQNGGNWGNDQGGGDQGWGGSYGGGPGGGGGNAWGPQSTQYPPQATGMMGGGYGGSGGSGPMRNSNSNFRQNPYNIGRGRGGGGGGRGRGRGR